MHSHINVRFVLYLSGLEYNAPDIELPFVFEIRHNIRLVVAHLAYHDFLSIELEALQIYHGGGASHRS